MSAKLSAVLDALKEIAPLELAEEWDNVGLLIDPSCAPGVPWATQGIKRILLTIDLNNSVVDEAIRLKSDFLVAYHPPIFAPMKELAPMRVMDSKQEVIIRAVRAGMFVYSPHTALDAVPGGINDWLCEGLGDADDVSPLKVATRKGGCEEFKIVVFVPETHVDALREEMARSYSVGQIGDYSRCSFSIVGEGTFLAGKNAAPVIGRIGRLERVKEVRLEMVSSQAGLRNALCAIHKVHPYEEPAWEIYKLVPKPMTDTGAGRMVCLRQEIKLSDLVDRIKRHLGLKHVRVAPPPDVLKGRRKIGLIGVCAGAGGSVFKNILCETYITGEMRHHDVLEKVEQGSAVILCDHTNTERGYLPVLKKKLLAKLGRGVRIDISKADREPLVIV